MEYKVFNENDIQSIIPMYIDYYNKYEDGEWTEQTVYKRIHQMVNREDSFGLIAYRDNALAGFALGNFQQYDDGITYDLIEIVITHKFQGQGLGTEFMIELENRVKEMGAFLIQFDAVNDDNHDRFYGRLGYNNATNFVKKVKVIG